MATYNISQIRRLVIRKKASADADWNVFEINPDNLGQDEVLTVNIAPRTLSRASQMGTTETPIYGTLDNFTASITFIPDVWRVLGEALGRWNQATYEGASANAGNMIIGDSSNLCGDGQYVSVICQGVCDDGSTADVEISRCMPSLDDDITIGGSDATSVTLNLHPIIYNATLHSTDGYSQNSGRFGDYSLEQKMRLNVTTGEYAAVSESE